MEKLMVCVVLGVLAVVQVSKAGSVVYQHRDTTLEDLKSIDSYVSSALPVLQDGFFIGTSRGPVLVKSVPHPRAIQKRPVVNSKYYNTLPRLIPAGFEGVATSHFNLGAASNIQPYSHSKQLLTVPAAQPAQYMNTQVSQPEQYVTQPVAVEQPHQHQFYHANSQSAQQYVAESQQPQQYVAEAQQPQYIAQPQQQQFQTEQYQPQQQFQREQYEHQPIQRVDHQPQQQLYQNGQYQPQQYVHQQSQQYIHRTPSQYISEQPNPQQVPQEQAHFSERNQQSAPLAQPSFQVDNLLKPENDQPLSTAFQTQVFGAERFHSQKLVPNTAVVRTSEFEETLPETLRNRFYKNANLATLLAQESLPIQGEQIIDDWDTNKIAKSKIRSLLQGAGLI